MLKKHHIFLFVLFIINAFSTIAVSQIEEYDFGIVGDDSISDSLEFLEPLDTVISPIASDTVAVDTLQVQIDTISAESNPDLNYFDEEISYNASDSIVFSGSGLAFLYGDASIQYKNNPVAGRFYQA